MADAWKWKGSNGNKFSVKGAYSEIEKRRNDGTSNHNQARNLGGVWKAITPFKAQITVWRLILDRLLNPHIAICSSCNVEMDTAEHLFVACSKTIQLWNHMVDWLGVCWASPWYAARDFFEPTRQR